LKTLARARNVKVLEMGETPGGVFCIQEEPIIVLSNGVKVRWVRYDAFNGHDLEIVDSQGLPSGCGNPWNLLELCPEADRKLVRDKKPGKSKLPVDVQCMMYHHILGGEEQVKKRMKSTISADCWGVFSTSADRTVVHTLHYDYRGVNNDATREQQEHAQRKQLLSDQAKLWRDIEAGLTVVCVMGNEQFMEIYYFKAGQIYLEIAVDHSITW
jgi:hypothetical protein